MSLVYHYCSPQTFLQIIEKKCIWLSSTNNMNDFSEGAWFTKSLNMVLKKKAEVYGESWCEYVWRSFSDNSYPRYIACFSKEEDSLSQWRAYAQDGEGVAIGFDGSRFGAKGKHICCDTSVEKSLCFCDAEYYDDLDIQEDLIKRADELRSRHANELDGFMKSARLFVRYCLALVVAVKNPAFKEENEKRLVYSALITGRNGNELKVVNPMGDIRHRISNGYLTSYFELSLRGEGIIKKIILGPRNKFHDIDMRNFLGLNELGDVEFSRSSATYR